MNDVNIDYIDELSSISLSKLYLKDLLDQVVKSTAVLMGADACALLLVDESRQTLFFKASYGFNQSAVDTVRISRGLGICWHIVDEKKAYTVKNVLEDYTYYYVPESGEFAYKSLMGVPIMDQDECLGVLMIQNSCEKEYEESEINELYRISRQVAGSIKAAWFLDQTQEKVKRLAKLNDFVQEVAGTTDIDTLHDKLLLFAQQLTGARVKALWRVDDRGEISAEHFPEYIGDKKWMIPIRNGIIAHTIKEKKPVRIDDVGMDQRFPALEHIAEKSVLCQPLTVGDKVVAVVCVCDRLAGGAGEGKEISYPFSGEEEISLTALSKIAADAIARTTVHEKLSATLAENRRNVKELSILFQLSMAMQRAISLEELLRVILSCVTVGMGLGFNRAILLLYDDKEKVFRGKLGLGPASGVEAEEMWRSATAEVSDENHDLLKWLLDSDRDHVFESRFNQMAQEMTIPHAHAKCPIIETILKERNAIKVNDNCDCGFCNNSISKFLGTNSFAIAPLIARDNMLGVIVVDNFVTHHKISHSDLKLLARIAAPAAWAIDNKRLSLKLAKANNELLTLQREMAQVDRVTTMGEIYAELAHELKNPLTTIGGFSGRIAKVSDNIESKIYSSIIVKEVERLEKLLSDVLDISRDGMRLNLELTDINKLVEETLDLYWRTIIDEGITPAVRLSSDLPHLLVDPAKLKQVVINLALNSLEAMSGDHGDTDRILKVTTSFQDKPIGTVTIKIEDTGGGIEQGDVETIFEPYFTTKKSGTGLGLPLCKKVIRLHHGSLEIDNRPGVGVTFSIVLPVDDQNRSQ